MSSTTSSTEGDDDDDESLNPFGANASDQYIFSYGRALDAKFSNPSIAGYYRPWRFIEKKRSGISRIFYARSREFRIALDISQFPQENIVVKIIGDTIVVKAQHPIVNDYLGKVKRELMRKFKTPPDLKLESIMGKYKRSYLILYGERNFEPMTTEKTSGHDSSIKVMDEEEDMDAGVSNIVSRRGFIDHMKYTQQPKSTDGFDERLTKRSKTNCTKNNVLDDGPAEKNTDSIASIDRRTEQEIIVPVQKSSPFSRSMIR